MANIIQKIIRKLDVYWNNPQLNQRNNRYVKQNVHDWAHYVHKAHVILARAFDFSNAWDREIVAYYMPFQWANIMKVAEAITSDKILLLNPKDLDEENPKSKTQLQNKWDKNHGQFLLKKSIEKGRKHGWLLYVPVQSKYLGDYYSGPPWHVYSADEAHPIDWDTHGHPIRWNVKPSNRKIDAFELTIQECFFFDVYQSDDFDGFPEGSQIWDDLIDYVFIKEAMKSFDQRMGNGFLILPVPLGTNEATKSAYQDKIMNVRTEMGLIWEVDDVEGTPQKPEWMTPQTGADFVAHLDKFEDGICTGMGFPKRWLVGDSEGAMESSGKDKLQVHSKLNAVFNQWKRFIKGVCLYHGWIADYADIEVRAGFKMELSEEEKVNIDSIKTTTIGLKTWLSINEQRVLDGFDEVSEEGADEVMVQDEEGGGDSGGFDGEDSKATASKSSDAKNDNLDIVMKVFTDGQLGVNELARLTGVSPTTISKIRSKFDTALTPIQKIDELVIKEDSFRLSDNVYEYEGVLLKPQTKYYDQYQANCITPKAEIERIFNDPTYPKEFRIGVTKSDDHKSQIPSEVLEKNAIGTVNYQKLQEDGSIWGKVKIDLNKSDKVLGSKNWVRDNTKLGRPIPMSVARWTIDKIQGKDRLETNIDIRSYVATRHPRNNEIGVS